MLVQVQVACLVWRVVSVDCGLRPALLPTWPHPLFAPAVLEPALPDLREGGGGRAPGQHVQLVQGRA